MVEPKIRFKNDNGKDYPAWKECVLDDVFEERTEAHLITEDAPQLAFTIEHGVIYPDDKKTNKRDFLMKDKSNKKFQLTEPDDIIYNPANLKFGAIHRNKLCRGVVSPIYAVFKTDQNPAFMEYVVRNPRFIKRSLKYLEGTVVKLMTLKPRDFLKMGVSIPCLEEQKKIADFLSDVDTLITTSEQELLKLKELKKGCLQKMFPRGDADVPEVRFPGFTGAWERRKFSEVFEGLQNNTLSRAELNNEGGEVKNVHYGDVLIKFGDYIDASSDELPYITDNDVTKKYSASFLRDGDIIIADTAEDETVGKCSEIVGSTGMKILSGLHTIPCRPREKYAPKFLGYYINSDAYHSRLIPLMQGIKVTSISKSALQDTDLILPKSYDEQAKIGEYFSNLDNLIALHQRECEKYKELKKGLLQQMFV